MILCLVSPVKVGEGHSMFIPLSDWGKPGELRLVSCQGDCEEPLIGDPSGTQVTLWL